MTEKELLEIAEHLRAGSPLGQKKAIELVRYTLDLRARSLAMIQRLNDNIAELHREAEGLRAEVAGLRLRMSAR